jgi:glycosyltransferase involved in cell wall biosynthesis
MKNVSVVIPAYNEEKYIMDTIRALKTIDLIQEIIVVDDGSVDNTAFLAYKNGARVIKLNKNYGKGKALNIGCLNCNNDIIAFIDADLGSSAVEVAKLLKPIIDGIADMTIATFPKPSKKGGFGFVKALANISIAVNGGKKLLAPLSGQRVLNKKALEALFPFAEGYGVEVIANIKAIKNGVTIKEVETSMYHRETGRNIFGFKHRSRQFLQILISLLKYKYSRGYS